MITVMLGTSPFPFNRALSWIEKLLEQDLISTKVFIQYGTSDISRLNQSQSISTAAFVHANEMELHINQSKLVISHAGQGLTRVLVEHQVPFVLIPRLSRYREHVDDHQLWYAEVIAKRGVCYCLSYQELAQAIINPPKIVKQPLFEGPMLANHLLKTYPAESRQPVFVQK